MNLKAQTLPQDDVLICKLSGRIISEADVNTLEQEIFPLLGQNYQRILVDLNDLTHINSTGISFFMKTLTKARVLGGDLIFFGVNGNVAKVFDIAKLNEVFTIYSDAEEGIRHFKA